MPGEENVRVIPRKIKTLPSGTQIQGDPNHAIGSGQGHAPEDNPEGSNYVLSRIRLASKGNWLGDAIYYRPAKGSLAKRDQRVGINVCEDRGHKRSETFVAKGGGRERDSQPVYWTGGFPPTHT